MSCREVVLAGILLTLSWALSGQPYESVIPEPVETSIQFRAEREGRVVENARICVAPFVPGPALLSEGSAYEPGLEEYIDRFLRAGTPRCYDIATPLLFTEGAYNLYAESSDAVSVHPDAVAVVGKADRILRQTLRLLPAARIDLSSYRALAEEGDVLVAHFPNESIEESPPTFRAIPEEQDTILVPTGASIIPMIVNGGTIRLVGQAVTAEEGQVVRAQYEGSPGRKAVTFTSVRRDDSALEAPELEVRYSNGELQSVEGLSYFQMHILEGVPIGPTRAEIGQEGWTTDVIEWYVSASESVSVAPRILRVGPKPAKLIARWTILQELPMFGTEDCQSDSEGGPREKVSATLTVARCRERSARIGHGCSTEWQKTLPDGSLEGIAEVELKPGSYVAELRQGPFLDSATFSLVSPDDRGEVDLGIHLRLIHGEVVRNGQGVQSIVQLPGVAVLSDENGTFSVPVSPIPRWSPIVAFPCDSDVSGAYFPTEELSEFTTYRIEIPTNRLQVEVRDLGSGKPVPEVELSLTAAGGRFGDEVQFRLDMEPTDSRGLSSAEALPADRPLELCASARAHEDQCLEIPALRLDEDRHVELAISGKELISGRFQGIVGVDLGRLYLTRDGMILDRVTVEPDGTFEVRRPPAGSQLIFVSRSHPLYVTTDVLPDGEELVLKQPVGVVAGPITISLSRESDRRDAPIGLSIGSSVIPSEVLQRYALLRRLPVTLQPGQRLTLPDVVFTAPVEVMLWFSPVQSPFPLGAPDPFLVPEVRRLADRDILTQPGTVFFE